MQDVLTQIQSGALVCPQSRQTLAVDAARTRLVTSDGRYSYPLLGETVPILLVDEEAMGEYAAGSARMTAEYAEDKPAPRRSLPLRILRRLVYLRGEPQVSDYRTQASIDACARVLSGQPSDAVCLSVGGGPGRCGDFTNVNLGPFPNVDVVADAHALPYTDGSVHAIYCEAVIEHLYAPHQAVGEMYRVLKPGGWCSPERRSSTTTTATPSTTRTSRCKGTKTCSDAPDFMWSNPAPASAPSML